MHVAWLSTFSRRHLQETLPGRVSLGHFQTCSAGASGSHITTPFAMLLPHLEHS